MNTISRLGIMALSILALTNCAPTPYQPTSEEIQNNNQEIVNKRAVQSVGMPSILHFAEKRLLKDIYEMRDNSISTLTYTKDINGHAHLFCHSLGFPLPYSTQYTNPMQEGDRISVAIPQSDPNGLYSPASAEGTWIMCLSKNKHKAHPAYVEDRVFTVIAGDNLEGEK